MHEKHELETKDRIKADPPRPQFRLRSLMLFTTLVCAVSAILGLMNVHPLHLLVAVIFFSIGVAIVAAQFELLFVVAGTRDRQRERRSN